MILGYSIYEITSLFFVYSFLGWCVEVAYCGLEEGHFVNRGFLNGPVCPIYGAGGVIIVLCLTPISDHVFPLFIGAMLLTSLLELSTGFALDKIFHAKWWDYSDKPFNIGGYICLKFSIYWGLFGIALMKGIHPAVYTIVKRFPYILGLVLITIFSLSFITDLIITVAAIKNLTYRARLMDETAKRMREISDKIGNYVYDGAVTVRDKSVEIAEDERITELREKYEESISERKQKHLERREQHEKEFSELKARYAELIKDNKIMQTRIIKAFPNMKMTKYNEQLKKLKEKLIK